jgi:hypothetical protein
VKKILPIICKILNYLFHLNSRKYVFPWEYIIEVKVTASIHLLRYGPQEIDSSYNYSTVACVCFVVESCLPSQSYVNVCVYGRKD